MDFEIASKGTGTPGVGNYALYAEVDSFLSIATTPAAPATQAEKVTIDADHTFTAPEGFRKMKLAQRQSSVVANGFGSIENKGARVAIELMFPGSKAEFDAFLKDDPDLIILVPDLDCDSPRYEQIGTKCSPAKIDVDWSYNSGRAGENDGRGYTVRVFADQGSRLHYTGTVTMAS